MTSRLLPAVVVVVVALTHLPGLDSGFHYDDGHSLLRNPHIRSLGNITAFFTDPYTFSENPEYAMYRPLVVLSYAVNHSLGGYDATGYHVLNLILHCCATWAVLVLSGLLGLQRREALLAALAFGLHPLATEPISYVSSRSELLAASFYALTVIGFIKARYATYTRPYWYAASLIAFVTGLLAKAVALSLPLMLLLVEALVIRTRHHPSRPDRPPFPVGIHLTYWVVGLLYFLSYRFILPTGIERSEQLRGGVAQMATQAKALIHYVYLGVMPVRLNVHQQFFESSTIGDPTPLLALLAGASLLLVSFHRAVPVLSFSMGWFLVILLPTFAVPLHILVNDHRVYLATFGLAVAFAVLARGRYRGGIYVWCMILATISWQRHGDWATELTLWTDAVAKAPLMPEAHYNLGHAHHIAGDLHVARVSYEEAVRLSPDYARAQSNLGALYHSTGDDQLALAALRRAVEADPKMVEALNNLGLLLAAKSLYGDAILHYRRALALRPQQAEIWMNLGLALRNDGQLKEAKEALLRALQLDPAIKNRFPAHGSGQH